MIEEIRVEQDNENSLIRLIPLQGTGSTNVTITVTDPDGNTFSETIRVDVVSDTNNGQPFLNDFAVPATPLPIIKMLRFNFPVRMLKVIRSPTLQKPHRRARSVFLSMM